MRRALMTLLCATAIAGCGQAAGDQTTQTIDRLYTEAIPRTTASVASTGNNLTALKSGLDALTEDDYATARRSRDSLPAGSLDHTLLSWALAYYGGHKLPSADVARAAQITQGWPGADRLRENSERALAAENPDAGSVLAAFASARPQSIDGAILYARALKASGRTREAGDALAPFWRTEKLEPSVENAIISEFGSVIARDVHRARMERMLYDERVTSAERVAGLAGGQSLAKAWAAVIRKTGDAGRLLDAVPSSERSAGWVFAKTRHLRRAGQYQAAAQAIGTAPKNADQLIDTAEWWNERRVLARDLLDENDPKAAYRVAAETVATRASDQADAAFHAGWIAFRFLNDPRTGAKHFAQILEVTDGPISQARGHYWLGRTAAVTGGDANAHYRAAARHSTTYYGQLAAAELGTRGLDLAYPEPTQSDRSNFQGRTLVQAIERLNAAGHGWRATPLYDQLSRELTSPGELALLAVSAERQNDNRTALRVGKLSHWRGVDVGALTHPVGAIPKTATLSEAGRALAYAIARQESEFHVSAGSSAGALGLLQLLPGTAQEVAGRSGLPYSRARLTSDPGYNATLGAAYLSEQLDKFDGSYILTFIGYNAGPRRSTEWIERFGHPKGKSIEDVVDWVERIPFTETRNYVQRVMENYQVYKWRLTRNTDIQKDLRFGR